MMKFRWKSATVSLWVVLALVRAGLTAPPQAPTGTEPRIFADIIFVEAPKAHPGELEKRFPEGSRLVRLEKGTGAPVAKNLTPELFAAAGPAISFDGTKILFSGQRSEHAGWQVWEMNADGSEKRELTHCVGDCVRPAYLPHDEIVYAAITDNGSRRTSELYVCRRDGSGSHPITFGPGNFQVEAVLRDGRILVSAESPLVSSTGRISRLFYTLRPDGTGLTPFLSKLRRGLIGTGAEELDDGTVLFVEKGAARPEAGGALAWIRPGTPHNSVITPARSTYWSARQLQGKTLVVAEENSRTSASQRKFDLYAFDLGTGTLGNLIYRDPKLSSVEAVPLVSHTAPRYYWSILHPEKETGRLICLNSYVSSDAPRSRFTARIARIRVMTLDQNGSQERLLGEAPVEADGSFYLAVPADQPMRFELLGAKGNVIHRQRSWIWVRPGEDRGCLGCHEDRARAPQNHWPLALKRFDAPIRVDQSVGLEPAGH